MGFYGAGIAERDLLQPGQIIQLGYPPNRIDILTSISGVDFDSAWESRFGTMMDGLPVWADIEKLLAIAKSKDTG